MGLLDEMLGRLSEPGPDDRRAPTRSGAAGGNMRSVLMALAPVALAMLARGRNDAPAGGDAASARDARMRAGSSPLDAVLGRLLQGGSGPFAALLERFQQAGFGEQTRSWVGTGRNEALPRGAVERAFGRDGVSEVARAAGVSEEEASRGLEELLPEMIDRMTPDGNVPDDDDALRTRADDLFRRL